MKFPLQVIILIILYSCTHMAPLDSNRGKKHFQNPTNGILIYSFSNESKLNSEFSKYSFLIKKQPYKSTYYYHFNSDHSKIQKKNQTSIYFNSLTLPAGKYEIIEFEFVGEKIEHLIPTLIPFEIKEKQITYIGHFENQIGSRKDLNSDEIPVDYIYERANNLKEDSIFYFQNFPLPTNISIITDINKPLM